MEDSGYRSLGDGSVTKTQVQPGWFRDYASPPVRRRFVFAPHVDDGSDQPRVELIGPVEGPGGDGPSNGMYALQKALRKRIDEGIDWLSIKSLPASRDAIPWFWNWADRRYAAWWDSQGLPCVQSPNMLFMNSGTPRIDAKECDLLDADERLRWIWEQLAYAERDGIVKFQPGHFDCSDAGMVYWWITGADQGGNKHATPVEFKAMLDAQTDTK